MMTDHEKAYWIADKIVALGDYAKEAAMLLRKQADELTAIKKQEPVAWMRNNTLWSVVKVQQHYPDDGWPYQPLCLCTAPIQEVVIDLLDVMFTAYEDGVDCYEDPDEQSGYVGKAIKLDDETFHKIADLLNNHKPRNYVAAAPKPEEG